MTQTLWNEPGSEDFQDYVPWWREHPLTLVVILIGVVGIATASWYVWHSLNSPDDMVLEDDLPVFYSDGGVVKETPKSPGGKRMPHQDNTVYQRLGAHASGAAKGGEAAPHLASSVEDPLPDAERKTPASLARYTQESVPMPPSESEGHGKEDMSTPATHPEGPANENGGNHPLAGAGNAPIPPMDLVVQGNEKVEIQRAPDGQEKIVVENIAAPKTKGGHSGGSRVTTGSSEWRIQLASLASREKAEKEWSHLKSEHSDFLEGLNLTVTEATVPGKGSVYRVQAGPLVNQKQAARLCRNLKERTAQCFPVPPK